MRRRFKAAFWLVCAVPAAVAAPVSQLIDATAAPLRGAVLAIAQTSDGALFAGSNRSLAVFDHGRWEAVAMPPDAYAFRGLAVDRLPNARRVYVGALGAVGYLEPDAGGTWRFTSLQKELAAAGVPDAGDIWHVFATRDAAIFIATSKVMRWRASGFEVWQMPNPHNLLAYQATVGESGEHVWIYQEGVGLLRMDATGDPVLAVAENRLPEHPVTWMAPPLIGLAEGAYRWNGIGAFERVDALSNALKNSNPLIAVRLDGATVAVGTFKQGLMLAKEGGGVSSAALDDNNVYALAGTADHLWVGLGSGLARLDQVTTASQIDFKNGPARGAPIKAASFGGTTYVLTSHGVFEVWGGQVLTGEARLWDMATGARALWVGGYGGIWRLGDHFEHVYDAWADIFQVTTSRNLPEALVFLEGYSLRALEYYENGGWGAHDLGAAVDDTPVSLLEGPDGDLWAGTMTTGVLRFGWRQAIGGLSVYIKARYRPGAGFPAGAKNPRLSLLDGKIVAFVDPGDGSDAGGILVLKEEGASSVFVPMPGFDGFSGIAAAAAGGGAYWLVQRRDLPVPAVIRVTAAGWEPVEVAGLDGIGEPSSISIVDAGRTLVIGGNKGLISVDESGPPRALRPAASRLAAEIRPLIQPKSAAFSYSCLAAVADSALFYQTRLRDTEKDWSAPSRATDRPFTGISRGAYTFEVRAMDRWGETGPVAGVHFGIPAPWWATWQAFTAYSLALALGVAAVSRRRSRRRLEAMRRKTEELDALVTVRTRELAERTRELEMSNSAKSDFLASISHEIRNPLNGITGLVAMLNEVAREGSELEISRSLAACSRTLTQVFEEVLEFSKLEFGPVAVRTRAFELDKLLEEVTGVFKAQAAQRGCDLHIRLPELHRHWRFLGDDEKIRTIVGNFVGNAVKYAPGAPVEIAVEIEEPASAQEHGVATVAISVTDRGPGVPTEEQELIFRKFVRGTRAKDQGMPGAGLGLASCKALAERVGGGVGVESPVHSSGGGATFYLRVPLAATTRETVDEHGPAGSKGRSEAAEPHPAIDAFPIPRMALIVDDQDYNRVVAERIVRKLGFEPVSSSSAEDALRRIADHEFRLILLDWELPGAKGEEVARAIKGRSAFAEASADSLLGRPVVLATTAHDSDQIRKRCREAGMDGFILKPIDERTLGATVEACLLRRGWHEAPKVADSGEMDFSLFEWMSGNDPEKAAAAAEYASALDRELEALNRALDRRDFEGVQAASHRLRSHAGLVHCGPLNELTRALENRARSAPTDELAALVLQIAARAGELKAKIAGLIRPAA